jgi:hypothetical protein
MSASQAQLGIISLEEQPAEQLSELVRWFHPSGKQALLCIWRKHKAHRDRKVLLNSVLQLERREAAEKETQLSRVHEEI